MGPLSDLKGLGGDTKLRIAKGRLRNAHLLSIPIIFKQTWGFGGDRIQLDSDPMQLGTTVASRRLVVRFGNFSVIDFFDKNAYSDG